MKRMAIFILCGLLTIWATGCSTNVVGTGVSGRVVDGATGLPVAGARITRRAMIGGGWNEPSNGVPEMTVVADGRGKFDMGPIVHRQFTIMTRVAQSESFGSFAVTADGYVTHKIYGYANRDSRWRVQAGEVWLKRGD